MCPSCRRCHKCHVLIAADSSKHALKHNKYTHSNFARVILNLFFEMSSATLGPVLLQELSLLVPPAAVAAGC